MEISCLNIAQIHLTAENDTSCSEISSEDETASGSEVMYIDVLDMATIENIIASNRRNDFEQETNGDDLNEDSPAGADYSSDKSLNLDELRERAKESMTRAEEVEKELDKNGPCSGTPQIGHNLKRQQENLYVCDVCRKEYHYKVALKMHILSHNSLKTHSCSICKTTFNDQPQLRMHLNTVHLDKEPFACTLCYKKFHRNSDLLTHMEIHTADTRYSCPICQKTFKFKWYIKKHMQTRLCSKKKATKNSCDVSEEQIERINMNLKRHECIVCDKRYKNRLKLKKHYHLKHSAEILNPYMCQICHRSFVNRAHVRRHVREVHCGVKPNYICDVCEKIFHKKCLLHKHISKIHSDK